VRLEEFNFLRIGKFFIILNGVFRVNRNPKFASHNLIFHVNHFNKAKFANSNSTRELNRTSSVKVISFNANFKSGCSIGFNKSKAHILNFHVDEAWRKENRKKNLLIFFLFFFFGSEEEWFWKKRQITK